MPKSKIPPIDGSCSAKEIFALRVLGDSMLPEFKDNTLLVIDPEAPVKDGSFVIGKVKEEYTLRQLRIKDKELYLQPLNDLYETIKIESIDDIMGLVIQQGSRKRNMKKYR